MGRHGMSRRASVRRIILAREPVVIEPSLTPMQQFAEDYDVADFLVDYVDWDLDESCVDTPPLRVPFIEGVRLR